MPGLAYEHYTIPPSHFTYQIEYNPTISCNRHCISGAISSLHISLAADEAISHTPQLSLVCSHHSMAQRCLSNMIYKSDHSIRSFRRADKNNLTNFNDLN